jgi:excisionase family DNA binding protein
VEIQLSPQRLAYGVNEAARISGLSKSWLYVEMASGRLPFRKAGTRRLILASDLENYLRCLPSEAA